MAQKKATLREKNQIDKLLVKAGYKKSQLGELS